MRINNYEESHPGEAQLLFALDGETEPGEVAAISQHVENCPVCRARWEQWKRLTQRIVEYHEGVLQARVPPIGALPRVEARARRNPAKSRVIAACAGVAAALVCLVWFFARGDRPAPVPRHSIAPAPAVAAMPPAPPEAQVVRQRRPRHGREGIVAADSASFVALPFSDDALPLGDATVVRVQLPMEELRLTGLTVEGEQTGAIIQADVLLGIDGLPRGIRLVR